jgi:hypothetical protein
MKIFTYVLILPKAAGVLKLKSFIKKKFSIFKKELFYTTHHRKRGSITGDSTNMTTPSAGRDIVLKDNKSIMPFKWPIIVKYSILVHIPIFALGIFFPNLFIYINSFFLLT